MSKVRKTHVLIIVENLPVPFDTRVWKEAKALRDDGYNVSVICPKGYIYTKNYECIEDIEIYRHYVPKEIESALGYLWEYAIAFLWEFFLSLKIFLKKPFKIIQACNPPDNIFVIALFFKIFGVRFIFDHHDLAPEGYLTKFNKEDSLFYILRLLEKLTFKTADVSLSTNESYQKIAVLKGGMSQDKVFVVRNGPEVNNFKPVTPLEELKYGKKYLIGYVGTMGEQEGIDLLLEVAQYMVERKKRKDVHFTLVGGGPALDRLRSRAERLHLGEYVNFTGRIPDKNLIEVLSSSDVCVNPDAPSEFNDKSTMIKIMEYMVLRKPIVQFDMTEGRFSAQRASLYAKNNDIVDFAEKIVWLLDHPEEREKMGEYGRNRVINELSWEHSVPNLLKAYEAALS